MLTFLISVILLYGFGMLTYLFVVHHTVEGQIDFILMHLAISVGLFMFWMLNRRYVITFKENKALRATLTELEGYQNIAGVISYTHFLSHVKYITAGAKRKGFKNHLLVIKSDRNASNTASIEHVLLESAAKVFRINFYDLITQRVKGEVLVFLQDTTLEGCNTAIKRLMNELYRRISLEVWPFHFNIYEVGDEDIETMLAKKANHQLPNEAEPARGVINAR